MRFGEMLRSLRMARDVSLRELARQTSVTQPFLSMVEQGKRSPPSLDVIYKLAEVLEADPMPLVGRVLLEKNWDDVLMLAYDVVKENFGNDLPAPLSELGPDWKNTLQKMEPDQALELLRELVSIRVDFFNERITVEFP